MCGAPIVFFFFLHESCVFKQRSCLKINDCVTIIIRYIYYLIILLPGNKRSARMGAADSKYFGEKKVNNSYDYADRKVY